ncbi:MAG TPA: AmmeMemoRadiSam system protein A [Thermoanaerobaculia bacterium]|jgi:AmmeMemoRadiSam system protein A
MLTTPQRNLLLRIARESIEAVLDGQRPSLPPPDQLEAELTRPSGCFVSLHAEGDLRGCIGSIQPVAPLFEAVSASAVNAAFRDPRFHPLRKDELPRIELEISVMSPIVPVADVAEIEVGRDGLIIRRGNAAGLLLPQVATQYGWDRETFLRQTCVKAGLSGDAWRAPGTRIERFSAEVFGEQTADRV